CANASPRGLLMFLDRLSEENPRYQIGKQQYQGANGVLNFSNGSGEWARTVLRVCIEGTECNDAYLDHHQPFERGQALLLGMALGGRFEAPSPHIDLDEQRSKELSVALSAALEEPLPRGKDANLLTHLQNLTPKMVRIIDAMQGSALESMIPNSIPRSVHKFEAEMRRQLTVEELVFFASIHSAHFEASRRDEEGVVHRDGTLSRVFVNEFVEHNLRVAPAYIRNYEAHLGAVKRILQPMDLRDAPLIDSVQQEEVLFHRISTFYAAVRSWAERSQTELERPEVRRWLLQTQERWKQLQRAVLPSTEDSPEQRSRKSLILASAVLGIIGWLQWESHSDGTQKFLSLEAEPGTVTLATEVDGGQEGVTSVTADGLGVDGDPSFFRSFISSLPSEIQDRFILIGGRLLEILGRP
ncbi:MAG: hypothetical protein KDD53_10175, partial [Bdellovibrionales bacterium]|nr:hypothetical protein [Bdellovibrionales bacterium]